jgi:hypothetical protein
VRGNTVKSSLAILLLIACIPTLASCGGGDGNDLDDATAAEVNRALIATTGFLAYGTERFAAAQGVRDLLRICEENPSGVYVDGDGAERTMLEIVEKEADSMRHLGPAALAEPLIYAERDKCR